MADLEIAIGGHGTTEKSGLDCILLQVFLKYKYQLRKGKKWYVFLFLFFEKKIQAQCESVA